MIKIALKNCPSNHLISHALQKIKNKIFDCEISLEILVIYYFVYLNIIIVSGHNNANILILVTCRKKKVRYFQCMSKKKHIFTLTSIIILYNFFFVFLISL